MTIRPELIEKLRTQRAKLTENVSPEKLEALHAKGLLSARERLDALFEEGTFQELGLYATHAATAFGMAGRFLPADGVIAGNGYVGNTQVAAFSQDFSVVAGTLADMYGCVTAGIAALAGPLHGGANTNVMKMLIEIGSLDAVDAWVEKALEEKRKIMGIGHRIYKVEDPRAKILNPLAEKLANSSGQGQWYQVADTIQQLARQNDYFIERNLYANVDYYSAVVLYTIGLPVDQFTCIFAVSRVAGWSSQVLEQLADNRLIRPKESYVGKRDQVFVPLGER